MQINEEEKNKKQEYLTQNIIEKGYNPEELSKYIVKIKGTTSNNLTFTQYVEIIEKFKNEQFADIYTKANNPSNDIDRKSAEYIYRPFHKEFKCLTPSVTPLLALEQKKAKLEINVTNPRKVEGGFFYKTYYTFDIECPIFQSSERRTYEDIEWFRQKLGEQYYLNFIPPLASITYYKEQENLDTQVKDIQNFFNELCRKKILRTSELLYNFLILNTQDFEAFKEKLNSISILPYLSYISCKGIFKSEITKDNIKFANSIYSNLQSSFPLYEKIFFLLNAITENFNYLEINFSALSKVFDEFSNISKKLRLREVTKKFNLHMGEIFKQMSLSYCTKKNLFNHEVREHFGRMYNDLKVFDGLNNKYKDIKYNYERFNDKLVEKKEFLFKNKQFSKFELEPNYVITDYTNIESNRKEIFDKMCFKDNEELEQFRVKVGMNLSYYTKEYFKVLKYHSEREVKFCEFLTKEKKRFLGDSLSLSDLFSIKL